MRPGENESAAAFAPAGFKGCVRGLAPFSAQTGLTPRMGTKNMFSSHVFSSNFLLQVPERDNGELLVSATLLRAAIFQSTVPKCIEINTGKDKFKSLC